MLFVPILVILLLAASGTPVPVQANVADPFACWASGPLTNANPDIPFLVNTWGEEKDEFVADRRDLGSDPRYTGNFKPASLGGPHYLGKSGFSQPVGLSDADLKKWGNSLEVYTLFDSVPELVDYVFALDVFETVTPFSDRSIHDRRVRMLAEKLAGATPYELLSNEDQRMFLPWQDEDDDKAKKKYLKRRSIGLRYDGVRKLSTEWIDPANPDGGRADDPVGIVNDLVASDMELTEGTTTMAGDGGVVHFGTTESIGQQVLFETRSECGISGSCTEITTYSNNPVPIVQHSNIREQNDGQIDRNTLVKDSRRIQVKDGSKDGAGNLITVEEEYEFDSAENSPSKLLLRDAEQGGYSRMHQEDTSSDELQISLKLKSLYRRDKDYDPDLGGVLTSHALPAMGLEPWTYVRTDKGRIHQLNDWNNDRGDGPPEPTFKHLGYRQPGLDRPFGFPSREYQGLTRATTMSRWDPKHIKWPVNFEDLNWYLYKLPGKYRESLWLYWLTKDGTKRVVFSAYGEDALPFLVNGVVEPGNRIPVCKMEGDRNYPGVPVRQPLNLTDIDCETAMGEEWDFEKMYKGELRGAHLPFDASDPDSEPNLLSPDLLVKQGVERAEDVTDPMGNRRLNTFEFSILESQPMGKVPPEQDGREGERSYGIPRDVDARPEYLKQWKSDPINPNMSHLLVFTYYEARLEGTVSFQPWDDTGEIKLFYLPKRQIRRVICRAIIHPSGFNPSAADLSSVLGSTVEEVISYVNDQMAQLGGWLSRMLASIAEIPIYGGIQTAELVCMGLGKLDDLTSLGNVSGPPPPALVDQEGRIRVNAAVQSKREGSKRCHRISSPPVSTCEGDSDLILQGKCLRLPEFRMQVRTVEFIRPLSPKVLVDSAVPDVFHPPLEYDEYRLQVPVGSYYSERHGERGGASVVNAVKTGFVRPRFDPVPDFTLDPPPDSPPPLHNRNRGLTRVYLDWDLRWDTITDFYDRVDGFAVVLHPDQKSVSFSVPEAGLPPFVLPKWVAASFPDEDPDDSPVNLHTRVEGFAVGGLGYYPDDSRYIAEKGSDSVVHRPSSIGLSGITPISSEAGKEYYASFNKFIHNMPLAPGFTHGFQVAPYTGVPGSPDFLMGPLSDTLWLSGDEVACDVWGDSRDTAVRKDMADIRKLYDCRGGGAPANLGYTDDEFRPGLLALTGTDICDDIFSSTPAGFTWDNAVVKQVWGLIWIIAGAVLFTLLVWQGLRMTYDIWLDPQPAIGFRELVPRFLLALLLAAGSLVICRMVLVVASDLTCFVAQVTGMSLWGVVGVTFGSLMDGYMAWYHSLDSVNDTIIFLLTNYLVILFFGLIVLVVMLYLLYLFAKVVLAMLMRIALLAVLVALSPLAFAFYASDATSHWTKKWVTLFLGTTFQQVVVLLVIYIGISMLGNYLAQGAEDGLTSLLVGMILAFVTLSLATAVPEIVNPHAKGYFSSFTQMGAMTLAAAAVVASAGVGAVVGGVGALAGGAARGASGLGGASGSGGGPSSGGGPDPGSGPGSSPASPSTSGGIISSVNRSPMGISVVPTGGVQPSGQPQAPGSQAPDSQASGSEAPGSQASGSQASGSQAFRFAGSGFAGSGSAAGSGFAAFGSAAGSGFAAFGSAAGSGFAAFGYAGSGFAAFGVRGRAAAANRRSGYSEFATPEFPTFGFAAFGVCGRSDFCWCGTFFGP